MKLQTVKPYMHRKHLAVVTTGPQLCPEVSLEGLWTGSADALDSLFQSQKCHDSPFLSNLPGLQWEEADNYPVLVQGQLLGEELEEAGAMVAVLLCSTHNTDGRDQKLDAGLCGSVHQ